MNIKYFIKTMLFYLVCSIFITTVFSSCKLDADEGKKEEKYSIKISIDDSKTGTADVDYFSDNKIETDYQISYIELEGVGPNNSKYSKKIIYGSDKLSLLLSDLNAGDWTFYATAYNKKEETIISGIGITTLPSTSDLTIVLNNYGSSEIRETLNIDIDSSSIDNPSISVQFENLIDLDAQNINKDLEILDGTTSLRTSIKPGKYLVSVFLKSDGKEIASTKKTILITQSSTHTFELKVGLIDLTVSYPDEVFVYNGNNYKYNHYLIISIVDSKNNTIVKKYSNLQAVHDETISNVSRKIAVPSGNYIVHAEIRDVDTDIVLSEKKSDTILVSNKSVSYTLTLPIAFINYEIKISDSLGLLTQPKIVISGKTDKEFIITAYPKNGVWYGNSCPLPNLADCETTIFLYDEDTLIGSKTVSSKAGYNTDPIVCNYIISAVSLNIEFDNTVSNITYYSLSAQDSNGNTIVELPKSSIAGNALSWTFGILSGRYTISINLYDSNGTIVSSVSKTINITNGVNSITIDIPLYRIGLAISVDDSLSLIKNPKVKIELQDGEKTLTTQQTPINGSWDYYSGALPQSTNITAIVTLYDDYEIIEKKILNNIKSQISPVLKNVNFSVGGVQFIINNSSSSLFSNQTVKIEITDKFDEIIYQGTALKKGIGAGTYSAKITLCENNIELIEKNISFIVTDSNLTTKNISFEQVETEAALRKQFGVIVYEGIKYTSKIDMANVSGTTFNYDESWNSTAFFRASYYGSYPITVNNFKIGKYEVTSGLWTIVKSWAENNGYEFGGAYYLGWPDSSNSETQPVCGVSWRDAIVWCNAYSEFMGLIPVYYTDSNYTIPLRKSTSDETIDYTTAGSQDYPYIIANFDGNLSIDNCSSNGYRLPSNIEWEFAARGGNPNLSAWTYTYSGSNNVDSVCIYSGNSSNKTSIVGSKNANRLGIYDMSGNIQEWTFGSEMSPWGKMPARGGSIFHDAETASLTDSSYWFDTSSSFIQHGFRIAQSN